MKTHKFLWIVFSVTLFSLVYVYQQTEIFRLGYLGQKKLNAFQDLLDKNALLRYNIEKNASLVQIGNRLSEGDTFQMPDTYRLVRSSYSPRNLRRNQQLAKQEDLLSRLFGIKREAQAKTIGR
ncbi:MAG: hypothetical protein HZA27_03420 [Candidatus Omnitrophica bacterium]|nr:hypothetical protein [Candidatus Omnitrophota bacterium]